MTTMPTMPLHGEWTADDLDALPDDGFRCELVDGVLLVSPSPLFPHQAGRVRFGPTRQLQPDVVVLPRGPLTYWLLDPDEPSLTVLELQDGAYVEVARAEGDQPLTVQRPFAVTLVPAVLVS